MSVCRVVQWNVDASDLDACKQALEAVAEHVKVAHPAARSFRTHCQCFGPHPRWTYFAIFEFESLTAWDCDHDTPACEAVWEPLYRLALRGSFATSFWCDPQRGSAPATWDPPGCSEECGAPGAAGTEFRR